MTGEYCAYNLAYYAEKANTYLNKIHRELFYTYKNKPLCPDVRLYLDAINEHVRAINTLLDSGAVE